MADDRRTTGDDARQRPAPPPRRFPGIRNSLIAVGVLVVAMALVLALLPSGPPAPDLGEVTDLARLESSRPAPRTGAEAGLGWRPTGSRTDTVGDRDTTTVFYARGGRTAAHTAIGGAPLEPPAVPAIERDGRGYTPIDDGLVWEIDGHSHVITGDGVPRDALLDLAAAAGGQVQP